MLEQDMEQKRP